MRKVIIVSLLIFNFSFNFNSKLSFASDDFDYGVNTEENVNHNYTIGVETEIINNETIKNLITYDYVPLLNKTILVPVEKNLSSLVRTFCKMSSGGYDKTTVMLDTYCENEGNYLLTVTTGNESLTTNSTNGSTLIIVMPDGEFSAYIKNNDNKDLLCNTYLKGIGEDTTPEEGFNINLTCYDKQEDGQKTNMWYWLGPVIGVVGAALIGGGSYAGVKIANGDSILPEV